MSFLQTVDLLAVMRVILDVSIIAFIFYRVILLLNRTRAVQLLIGVALILLLDIFARFSNLETLSWLITNVSTYLVFGLIVLLQPELRRLIAEIGQMPLFRVFSQDLALPYEPIIEAARLMAQSRTGSIMCILRRDKPEAIIETAVRVEGIVTAELLMTIFHKDTALHDGAVLIEGGRILAASCYLPLSNSTLLKKTHGARHRAGMGISEESDAFVIVTSEETGRISVMMNGDLRTPIKAPDLRDIMVQIFEQGKKSLADALEEPSREQR